jgi:hypothetical protein
MRQNTALCHMGERRFCRSVRSPLSVRTSVAPVRQETMGDHGALSPAGRPGQGPERDLPRDGLSAHTNDRDAQIAVAIYFSDRAGAANPALRFNDLEESERVPPGTDYSSVFESDLPIGAGDP